MSIETKRNGRVSAARRKRPLPSIVWASVALVAAAAFGVPGFASRANLVDIGLQVAILVMIAMPMTLVILSEGLDLSVGALLSLCGVVFAQMLGAGAGVGAALGAAAAVGIAIGFLNGMLVARLALPPFVVTLGTLGVAHGVALVLTDGNAVVVANPAVGALYGASVLGVPFPIACAVAAYAVTHLLLYHTRFGAYVFAIGGNRDALTLAGVRARVHHVAIYAMSGLFAGLAALLLVGRMNAAEPNAAIGMEFDAIAAVVLGGTSFERGAGWLPGTAIGVLTIGVLRNALNLVGIESSLQVVTIGLLVLAVVVVDSVRQSRVAGAQA
ncbi:MULTISPECIES: ABC transporter permease [unclassified Burkholderia]|uniref:ABC transporter permease n=1 Tax=unclassified Burkholderia TaxID=2613784 RepID=UPI000F585FD8|nr:MULTISPECIES: ABC transporter permease [unclassified Burkholderia]RQR35862.1 ABC transporter permease [Burkholderia sp. Bp9131]RQR69082.1 ABC transporter permease [Burkholderia sp. Bp9015]RQS04354.1 ABC transporter permease [Burkholderia sp. Bp8991]RQS29870.1 ABC transporter permease [Burkholderia sp. Bp8995]RQS47966.1 ABC transporter permease [Burkholderia sp. Bp8989]